MKPAHALAHVPALPAMRPFALLRALLKRPGRPRAEVRAAMAQPAAAVRTDFRLDRLPEDDIARYRAAFGFEGDHIPVTWWYLLAQRAHLATMLDPGFPFRIAGLVHMDNALTEQGRIEPGQPLLLRTVLRLLPPSANGALRCTLETAGSAGDAPVFSCTSTYLVQRGTREGRQGRQAPAPDPASGELLAHWTLDAGAGRRYARLSGDWNPIHLAGWSARLMGMRAPVIHGMHTLGASCAALERRAQRRVVAVGCRFRAPVALGSTVSLRAGGAPGEFVVDADGRPAVSGHCMLA